MRPHARAAAASVLVALVAAAPAGAESGRLADFGLRLTSSSTGTPTGMTVHVLLRKDGDPNGKPSPLRSAVIQGPTGLRFDTGALPQCTASDQELQARGSDACPPETQLTVGAFSAITGFGPPVDPLAGDDHVFNGPNQLIEVITAPGAPVSPGFDRLTIDGARLTAHPPMAPGAPPDGESSVRSIDFQVPVRSAAGRPLITTPPDCPAGGRWTTTATFGFANGDSDSVTSVTPCTAAAARADTLRLKVGPRRVTTGRLVRFRMLVRSSDARCVAHARVHFARHAVRTDAHGRVTLTALLRHPGVHRVRASHRGCGRATTAVRARRG